VPPILGRTARSRGLGRAAPRADGDAARGHADTDRHELLRAGDGDLLHVLRHLLRRARLLSRTHRGTLERLAAAPTGPGAILAGKSQATFVYGVASLGTVGIVTSLAFDAHWEPPLVVLALIGALSLTMVGLTALVITVARTERQADGFASLLTFGLVLLGGNFVFIGGAPPLVRTLALLTPNGWALRAFTDLAGGAAWTAAAAPLMAILAFAAAIGAAAFSLRGRVADL
jgi:ABC-2 type transport system permease protein